MRRLSIVTLLAVAGCSSTQRGDPDARATAPRTTQVVTGGGRTVAITSMPTASKHELALAAPPERVWQALQQAYTTLEIPIATIVSAEMLIGNEGFKVRRQLGGVRLTKYLDCGGTSGEPNAETYQVTMSLLSRVTKDVARGSVVSTTIEASAVSVQFGGRPPVVCTSTGELERRVHKLIEEQTKS